MMIRKKISINPRHFVLSMIMSVACIALKAQSIAPKNNSLPTSPEAALFSRFGDIPVGQYTGTAEISIPLYTIKESGIEIPLLLRYQSSGIKVSDEATWVGLGWDFSPGGAIIQEVRGKSDDFEVYHLNSSNTEFAAFQTRLSNAGSIGSYKTFQQWGRGMYDMAGCPTVCDQGVCRKPFTFPAPEPANSEPASLVGSLLLGNGDPDIYHYSFPGFTGSFFINPETSLPVQIEKQEEIKIVRNSQLSFTITTLDGTIYTFSNVEIAYDLGTYATSERSGKTYRLTSIVFTNGKSITFDYVNGHTSGIGYRQQTRLWSVNSLFPEPPISYATQSDTKVLSKITTADAIIDFNTTTRDDINWSGNDNLKKLSSVDITATVTNQKIKSFDFVYSYFPYDLIGQPSNSFTAAQKDILGKRLKLESVKEKGYTASGTPVTSIPPYTFAYDMSHTMPMKCAFAKDMFGYFNGENNAGLLPDLDFFQYETVFNVPFTYLYTKANRYANKDYAGAYMLNKITYPTGGSTQFEYESNTFNNQYIPDKAAADLVRASVWANDNSLAPPNSDVIFAIDRNAKIHFDNYISDGYGNPNGQTPLTYAQMSPCYIELYKIKIVSGVVTKTTLKKWDLSTITAANFATNHGAHWTEDYNFVFDNDNSPNTIINYHIATYYPDNLNNSLFLSAAGVSCHINYNNYALLDMTKAYGGGLRVKTIKKYTDAGILAGTKKYTYSDGRILNRFDPIRQQYRWDFNCTGGGIGSCLCPTALPPANYYELTITSELIPQGGNLIGYGQVEETDLGPNGSDNIGRKMTSFANIDNLSANFYPVVVNQWNGRKNWEETYDNAGTLKEKTSYSYVDLFSTIQCYYGFSIVQNFSGNYDPDEAAQVGGRSKYSYYAAPIISQWNKLSVKTLTKYEGDKTFTSAENYAYTSLGKLRSIAASNSKNEQVVNSFYYAPDYGTTGIYANMIANSMTGIPLKVERSNQSIINSKQEVFYNTFGSLLLPLSLYDGNGTQSFKQINYDKYDDKGNILQFTGKDGVVTAMIWGYNKLYPVAKVTGRGYDDVVTAASLNMTLINSPSSDAALRTELNKLRTLANCQATTLTYQPLVGQTSETDPNGRITYYEYDAFGRLSIIRDHENNILKKFCYNYAGQTIDCTSPCNPTPVWQNTTTPVRCQTGSCGNTGYDEQEQRDVNPCSPTYNTLRWLQGTNPNACTVSTGNIITYNNIAGASGYTAVYTKSGFTYTFPIPASPTTGTLGCLADGKYTLTISKTGTTPVMTFGNGCTTVNGTSATMVTSVQLCHVVSIDNGF